MIIEDRNGRPLELKDTTRMNRWEKFWYFNGEIIWMVLGIVLLVAFWLAIEGMIYGDPMCAFKQCIVIKEN